MALQSNFAKLLAKVTPISEWSILMNATVATPSTPDLSTSLAHLLRPMVAPCFAPAIKRNTAAVSSIP
jgi:hypothetical protein